MGTELSLTVIEAQLDALGPKFDQVLQPFRGCQPPAATHGHGFLSAAKLLECGSQSLLNAAMTAACLGLEVDGVTGQGLSHLNRREPSRAIRHRLQGFQYPAGRSGYSINSGVVRGAELRLSAWVWLHSPQAGAFGNEADQRGSGRSPRPWAGQADIPASP
jgi:hypothetical protein